MTKKNLALEEKRNCCCLVLVRETDNFANSPWNVSTRNYKKKKSDKRITKKWRRKKRNCCCLLERRMANYANALHQMLAPLPPALSVFLSFSFIPRSVLKFTHDWLPTISSEGLLWGKSSSKGRRQIMLSGSFFLTVLCNCWLSYFKFMFIILN